MVRTVETKIRVLRNGAQLTELEYAPNAAPTIRCSDSAAIKMSMTGAFRPNDAVDWLSDELQAVLVIDGVEHPAGVFLPANVTEETENGLKLLNVEAYDRSWLARDSRTATRQYFAAGTNYAEAAASMLAASIGQALWTTAFGLIISIPAVAAFYALRNKANRIILRMTAVTMELLNGLRNVEVAPEEGAAEEMPA